MVNRSRNGCSVSFPSLPLVPALALPTLTHFVFRVRARHRQIKEINVTPDPPAPGKNLTVNVKAEVLKTVDEGAWAHVVVKLGLIKLLQKDFDICEEAYVRPRLPPSP